jgi:hypothetical protein
MPACYLLHPSVPNAHLDPHLPSPQICERFQNADRSCVTTRGCATAAQCKDDAGNVYKGEELSDRYGGMKVTTTCCKNDANAFNDDDLIAVDLSGVCNAAPRTVAAGVGLWGTIAVALVTMLLASHTL